MIMIYQGGGRKIRFVYPIEVLPVKKIDLLPQIPSRPKL